jgi:hypothetical protein
MKTAIIAAVVAAAALAGCTKLSQPPAGPSVALRGTPGPNGVVATMTPSGCRTLGDRPGSYRYSAGPGDRLETAIVIDGVKDDPDGVSAEYLYIYRHLPGWKACGQALLNPGTRVYDQIDLENDAGKRRPIFFDITNWIGKGMTP